MTNPFRPGHRTPLAVLHQYANLPLVTAGPTRMLHEIREDYFDADAAGWVRAGVPSFHAADNIRAEPYANWL